MAWARVNTYGLLGRWRVRMLQQAYQFQQVNDGFSLAYPNVWIQQERNELANQLLHEFRNANKWLGYNPQPIYDEEIVYLNPTKLWFDQTIQLSKTLYLQSFGVPEKTLINTASVSYTNNQATIELVTSEITTGELAVYFLTSDGAFSAADDLFRIYDITIDYVVDRYIITGHKSLFVIPELQLEKDSFINGDPDKRNELTTDNTNFVSSVGIYRVTTNAANAVSLLSFNSTNTLNETPVTPTILNNKDASFRLVSTTLPISASPYAVKVKYLAGYPLQENGNMYEPFENIIIRRARASLPENALTVSYRVSAQWENDKKSYIEDGNTMFMNPLGTRYIDYYTWQTYRNYVDPVYGDANLFRM